MGETVSIFVILAAYLGFAGVLGSVIAGRQRGQAWITGVYAALIFLPASLGLPFHWPHMQLTWVAGLMVIVLFARQPAFFPIWLWEPRFAFAYFGVVMFLIWFWAFLFEGPTLWLGLGAPAILAGILSIRRAILGEVKRGQTAA